MPQPPTLRIVEVFPSLQGEGLRQGEPTVFVRLAGCNLRCSFCDTKYARRGGDEASVEEVLASVSYVLQRFSCSWVCITGGEPLLQDIAGLVAALKKKGLRVQVETNGTHYQALPVDWYSVSPKPPRYAVRREFVRRAKEVKLVISRELTFDIVRKVGRRFPRATPLVLQVESNRPESVQKGWGLVQRAVRAGLPNIRLSLQAHKILKLP